MSTRNQGQRQITTSVEPIKVESILEGSALIGRSTKVALLSQTVTRTYPGAQAGNSKQDGLYEDKDFSSGSPREFKQVRYCLVKVPHNVTLSEVQDKVDTLTNATIYRILSNNVMDVITDEQKTMLNSGRLTFYQRNEQGQIILGADKKPITVLATVSTLQDRYEVKGYERNPDGTIKKDINGPILRTFLDPSGQRQFRAFYFSTTPCQDIDMRVKVLSTVEDSAEVQQIPELMEKF
jgi:hypothetical protein